MAESPAQIEAAIAALEAQRAALGNAVTEIALAPLRDKLAAARSRERSDQQLKTVTVLFLDVVGSTALSRTLDPEDIHAIMDGALARFSAAVEAQHGRVLQYAGDSLLAVFGADAAHEDDPENAVRAGLGILDEARRLADDVRRLHGHDGFNVRVGINTGAVLLGGGVDAENSIRGIAVNVAARMEQSAPPGALRISHGTYRHVRGVFDVTEEPPISVKGIAEPVRSYLVQRAKPRAFRLAARGIDGVETRLVGRDAELAKLTDTLETVLEDGTFALVTLVGDAGLGKSRLLLEFHHWIELRPEKVWLFFARAQPYGHNLPYGLLRDLFAWRFEILDSDSQAVAQEKLARGVGALFGERADEQTALIGQLIGLDYSASPHIAGIAQDARQIRDRAFHAAAQYFRLLQRSGGAAIAVLLEDLHWADDGSLDFINHLCQACADVPMMVLGLARPALYERRPLWGSGQHNHERVTLSPLSKRASRELADALLARLDPIPAALRDLLTTSAEGNPYFVEELVAMLIDDGVIVTRTGDEAERWHVVADKLLGVHVPPTLAGLLQARLDALAPPEKATLQHASVIGHVFWDEPLLDAGPNVADSLDSLTRRELVHGRETTAFEGARECVFKHHLLHQSTYDSVLKRDKREGHRRAAEWLVARCGERASAYHGVIADHYERAGDTVQAAHYLRLAGQDAAKAYANTAALDYLARALALTPSDDAATRAELLRTRIDVFSCMGRRAEQQADVAALEALAQQLDDDVLRAQAAGCRASYAVATGDYLAAAAAGERAAAWADGAGRPGAALAARMNWARALQLRGDASAQEHTERALELARSVGDRKVETAAVNQLGIVAWQLGHYGRARKRYAEALALARASGDRAMEGGVLNNLGDIERYLGHYAEALELLLAGQRVSREIGRRTSEPYLLCNMALVAFMRGDLNQALAWAEQAIAMARPAQDRDLEANVLCTQGHVLAALGRHDDATAAYRASLAIYREIGRPTMQPEPLAGLARVALATDRLDDALAHVNTIVAHFDAGGSVDGTEDPMWIHLTCHEVLSALRDARARAVLERAHALLMQRAESLEAPERASFLSNVPSHRAIVAAWAAS